MTKAEVNPSQHLSLQTDLEMARLKVGQSLPADMLLDLRSRKPKYFESGQQSRAMWNEFHRSWRKEWDSWSKPTRNKMILTLCKQFGDARFLDDQPASKSPSTLRDWEGGVSLIEAWADVFDRRIPRPIVELLGFHTRLQIGNQQPAFELIPADVEDVSSTFNPSHKGQLRDGTGPEVLRASEGDFVERANGRFPEQAGRLGPRSLAYITHREAWPLFLSELCENRIQQSFFEREFVSDRIPSIRIEVRLMDDLELHSWNGRTPAIRELRKTYFRLLKRFALEEDPDLWRMILVSGYESPYRSQSWDLSEQNVQWIAESELSELIEYFARSIDSPAWLMECPPTEKKSRSTKDPDVLIELGIQPQIPAEDSRFFLGMDTQKNTFSFRDELDLSSQDAEEAVVQAVQFEVSARL